MQIGYARVSTTDQDPTLQLDALRNAGCEKIFEDQRSGATTDRPGLAEALEYAREGDTVVVWKLDRLGRSLKSLIELTEELAERGVDFKSLTDGIDTSTPAGRFFFHVMAALAQMERELIVERTRAGLEAARRMGRTGGRPRKLTDKKLDVARALIKDGMPKKDVADHLGVARSTLYTRLSSAAR